MITLDGIEVKVGDRLWCTTHGWVTVARANYESDVFGTDYPIYCVDNNGNTISFNSEGKFLKNELRRLYWDELKFEIPKPPKRRVEKWQWVFTTPLGELEITKGHYSVDNIRHALGGMAHQKVDHTRIEVEE